MVSRHTGQVSSRLDSSSALGCLAHRIQQQPLQPTITSAPLGLSNPAGEGPAAGCEAGGQPEEEEGEAAEQEEGVEGAGEQQGQAGRQKSEPGYQVVLFQMRSGGWLTPDCQGYIEEL